MFAFLMGLKSISPRELQALLRKNEATVIDVNSRQSWIKAHVPGALHVDYAHYNEADLPSNKDALVVFYCANPFCRKAPNAARRASKMGYEHVRVMSAGITGWLDAQLPTEAGA